MTHPSRDSRPIATVPKQKKKNAQRKKLIKNLIDLSALAARAETIAHVTPNAVALNGKRQRLILTAEPLHLSVTRLAKRDNHAESVQPPLSNLAHTEPRTENRIP